MQAASVPSPKRYTSVLASPLSDAGTPPPQGPRHVLGLQLLGESSGAGGEEGANGEEAVTAAVDSFDVFCLAQGTGDAAQSLVVWCRGSMSSALSSVQVLLQCVRCATAVKALMRQSLHYCPGTPSGSGFLTTLWMH